MNRSFAPAESAVRVIGRTYFDTRTGIRWCVQSASGIEFRLKGELCTLMLFSDDLDPLEPHVRLCVTVDGEPRQPVMLSGTAMELTVSADGPGPHTVRVLKLSEAKRSALGIGCVTAPAAGGISPTESRPLLIEFVGDSLTCGYGIETSDPEAPFTVETENAMKSFAFLTAEKLGADWSAVSYSGFGILSGYTEEDIIVPSLVPQLYGSIGCPDITFGRGIRPETLPWDFKRQPDIVAVNLGTNDSSYVRSEINRLQAFSGLYAGFVAQIREKNPQAAILCFYGMMEDTMWSAVSEAVRIYREKTGDSRVYLFRQTLMNPADGYGARWHPSEISHRKAAGELSRFISENILPDRAQSGS